MTDSEEENEGLFTEDIDVFRSADEEEFEEAEKKSWILRHWFGMTNLTIVLIWTAVGIGVSMCVGGWTFITAAYVVVQIVTTIGYGDTSIPESLYVFYTIYVFFGIAIVANVVNTYTNQVLEANEGLMRAKLRSYETRMVEKGDDDEEVDEQAVAKYGAMNSFIASFVIFMVLFAFGSVFYRLWEPCSCSYGSTRIDGCIDEMCADTGGQVKTWRDSVYMSIITMVTVGFGDFSPQSVVGRWVGLFWMIISVIATGNLISSLGELIDQYKPQKTGNRKPAKFGKALFDRIDKDNNGSLSRAEFYTWMLVTENLVTESVFDRLDSLFDSLDDNKTGKLEYSLLEKKFGAQKGGENGS